MKHGTAAGQSGASPVNAGHRVCTILEAPSGSASLSYPVIDDAQVAEPALIADDIYWQLCDLACREVSHCLNANLVRGS